MAEDDVFRILLTMRIKDGLEHEFEQTWLRIGESVTSHPSNLGQWLSRGEEPGLYYITSDWVDEAGFRAFESSAKHVRHRELLQPYRSSGSMATMRVVAHLPAAASTSTHADWELIP